MRTVDVAQPWLDRAPTDWVSVALFAAMGGWLADLPAPWVGSILALVVTLAGLVGVGIERGSTRKTSWGSSVALAALATVVYVGVLAAIRPDLPWLELGGRGLPVLLVGAPISRLAARLDRGESGWRAAAREGPPLGSSPTADRIAGLDLPRPLSWALLLLLPATLVLRGLCVGSILMYQLTASRLMPSACRYEPSCSRYGFGAFLRHGCVRGGLLTFVRLLRCSPIGSGGYDPVPRRHTSGLTSAQVPTAITKESH